MGKKGGGNHISPKAKGKRKGSEKHPSLKAHQVLLPLSGIPKKFDQAESPTTREKKSLFEARGRKPRKRGNSFLYFFSRKAVPLPNPSSKAVGIRLMA